MGASWAISELVPWLGFRGTATENLVAEIFFWGARDHLWLAQGFMAGSRAPQQGIVLLSQGVVFQWFMILHRRLLGSVLGPGTAEIPAAKKPKKKRPEAK